VVERGSASDTTGKYDKKFCIPKGCQKFFFFHSFHSETRLLASLRDAVFFCGGIPVVSLAEPRSTTG